MCIYIHTLICIYTTKLYLLEKVKFSHHHSKLENNFNFKDWLREFLQQGFLFFQTSQRDPVMVFIL